MADPTFLQILWFVLIAVLWIGFFFFEGFDFGVAMLYFILGKDPRERRVMVNSIGPTWDGNEVWLLTAGGAMFAAFPGWYSTLFSGLYLPLFLVLLGLIIRGVSFEYRAMMPDDRWRDTFDWCSSIGSFIVSLVFGVGFANFFIGMPVAGNPPHMTQSFWSLFSPLALLGGVLTVLLFTVHGAVFLTLKTEGSVYEKAEGYIKKMGPVVVVLLLAFVVCANVFYPTSDNPWLGDIAPILTWGLGLVSVLCLVGSLLAHNKRADTPSFIFTGVTIATLFASIFVKMYGSLGFISEDPANPLNIVTASSSPKTLGLMSIFAAIFVPIVLGYTIWSYYVFRKRLSVANMPPEPSEDAKDEAHFSTGSEGTATHAKATSAVSGSVAGSHAARSDSTETSTS